MPVERKTASPIALANQLENPRFPQLQAFAKERVQNNFPTFNHVIPAQAGNQFSLGRWFPARAGMTKIAGLTAFGKLFQTRS